MWPGAGGATRHGRASLRSGRPAWPGLATAGVSQLLLSGWDANDSNNGNALHRRAPNLPGRGVVRETPAIQVGRGGAALGRPAKGCRGHARPDAMALQRGETANATTWAPPGPRLGAWPSNE